MYVEVQYEAGLLAYVGGSSEQEMLNTAALGGGTEVSTITKRVVLSCHTAGSSSCAEDSNHVGLSDTVSCESNNEAALGLSSNCDAVTSSNEVNGADSVEVSLFYGTFSAVVWFRVWYPTNVTIHADDYKLDIIRSPCTVLTYQQSALKVTGRWSCGHRCEVTDAVDVTRYAVIESSNDTVIIVVDGVAVGLSPGVSMLSILGTAGVELVVSDDTVSAENMVTPVLNNVAITSQPTLDAFSRTVVSQLSAMATLSLTQEGDVAHMFPYILFSDGTVSYVGGNISVTAWDDSYIRPVANDNMAMEVAVGAVSIESNELVTVSWVLCGEVLASDNPWFAIKMPPVTAIRVSSDEGTIVRFDDPLSFAPVSHPTTSSLEVVVEFADGSSRDMTFDFRTLYSCTNSGIEIVGNTVTTESITELASVDIEVSLPAITNKTATLTLSVDTFSAIELVSNAHPTCATDGCLGKTLISRYPANGTYFQQLSLGLVASSEKGGVFSFALDENVVVSIDDAAVVTLTASSFCNGLTPCVIEDGMLAQHSITGASSGVAYVTAVWANQTAEIMLTVDDTEVRVSGVSVVAPSQSFLNGVQYSEHAVTLSITFSDGSTLPDISAGEEGDVNLPGFASLLEFTSSDPDIVTVSKDGFLTLLANSIGNRAIEVSIAPTEDATLATVSLFCNLEPACFDVDLGNEEGAPFDFEVDDDGTFLLPVILKMHGSWKQKQVLLHNPSFSTYLKLNGSRSQADLLLLQRFLER